MGIELEAMGLIENRILDLSAVLQSFEV